MPAPVDSAVTGIHHVTAISGDARENLSFYTGLLGLRLVKRTVNQDVPDTYHLFYADGEGRPGTDLTFFPWPNLPPARPGIGLTMEAGFSVGEGSLDWWAERLAAAGLEVTSEARFGENALVFRDPHGLGLSLTETDDPLGTAPWDRSTVPAEHQLAGFHAVRLWERDLPRTARFLTEGLGFEETGEDGGWHRFEVGAGGPGRRVELRELPQERRGMWGTGAVHHVAFRVDDDDHQARTRERVAAAGQPPTEVIDRFWFRSIYFREPGGALFEVATDGPGFAVDEDARALGERLILPPWLEPRRAEIEAGLAPLGDATVADG
ncbi:MAG: ring-cleaving dioxygenase [Gemmatimonadota bacterium]|nr:ring-cleaving dioxygenase [Gemmatimonadota bacterium]